MNAEFRIMNFTNEIEIQKWRETPQSYIRSCNHPLSL